jgi:hypothetical protein
MFARVMPILLLSCFIAPRAMAAQVQPQPNEPQPDENCILVQNHTSVTFGDIASQLGRKLLVRTGKINHYKDSFRIEAPDTVKEGLLGLQTLVVEVDGHDVTVNFVSPAPKAGNAASKMDPSQGSVVVAMVNINDVTAKNVDKNSLEDRCGDRVKNDPHEGRFEGWAQPQVQAPPVDNSDKAIRGRIASALARTLQAQTPGSAIKVTWEAAWVKVPFSDTKYVTRALAFTNSKLVFTTRSWLEIQLEIRPMPRGNNGLKLVAPATINTPPDVTFSPSSFSRFDKPDAHDSASITAVVPQRATLGELYKLVGLELPPLPQAVQETVIEGQITIPIDALKKQQLLNQISTTIPDKEGFSQNRKVNFLDD